MAPGKSKKVASAGIRNSEADGVDLNEYWRVGPFLAKGAQASVHALLKKKESSKSTTNINSSGIRSRTGTDDDDQYYVDSEYVVKVAEMPDKLAPVKAKKSLMEINADSLNGEYMCYNNLRPLQGRLIPRLPPFAANARDLRTFPPITGVATVNGKSNFRYLVLERMDDSLTSLVDRLLSAFAATTSAGASSSVAATVSLGPILSRMIKTVQEIHAAGRLVVDVKTDNWMIVRRREEAGKRKGRVAGGATTPFTKAAGKSKSKALAQLEAEISEMSEEIRCLDLALAHSYRSYTGTHREDRVAGPVQEGTPLYASAHVHGGHLPSRRDDLFSVGIVFAELLIRIHAAQMGTLGLYENCKCTVPTYLPWATETSEEAMAEAARSQLFDPRSEFYRRLPTGGSAKALLAYFERVHAVGYDRKPPYDELLDMVRELPVAVASAVQKKKQHQPPLSMALAFSREGIRPCPGGASESGAAKRSAAATAAQPRLKSPPEEVARMTSNSRSASVALASTSRGAKRRAPETADSVSDGGRQTRVGGALSPAPSKPHRSSKIRRREATVSKKGGQGNEEDYHDAMDVDETSLLTAQTSPSDDADAEMMDVDDDVEKVLGVFPSAESKKPDASRKAKAVPGVELKVVSGPGAGLAFHLVKGAREVLEIGFNPTCPTASPKVTGKTIVASVPDPCLARAHTKFVLVITSGGSRTVEVQNLDRKGGSRRGKEGDASSLSTSVQVNGAAVPTKVQAFCGDKIRLGANTILHLARYDSPILAPEKENVVRRRAAP